MYDHQNRLTGFYEHDGPDTSTQEEILQSRTVYGYNIDGTLHHIDYGFSQGNVKGLQFTYDQDKRIIEIDAKKAVGTETVRQYAYDRFGRISQITDYYDFLSGSDHIDRQYTYDDFGRLLSATYIDSADGEDAAPMP